MVFFHLKIFSFFLSNRCFTTFHLLCFDFISSACACLIWITMLSVKLKLKYVYLGNYKQRFTKIQNEKEF